MEKSVKFLLFRILLRAPLPQEKLNLLVDLQCLNFIYIVCKRNYKRSNEGYLLRYFSSTDTHCCMLVQKVQIRFLRGTEVCRPVLENVKIAWILFINEKVLLYLYINYSF